jgi:hypothetical protein
VFPVQIAQKINKLNWGEIPEMMLKRGKTKEHY